MKTAVIIDGNNMSYASYFSHKGLCVQEKPLKGFPTGMLYGFLMSLMRLSEVFKRSPMLIVWDGESPSWQHKEYRDYKGNRQRDETVKKEVSQQFEPLNEILNNLDICTLRIAHAEADNLIGIVSHELCREFNDVVIRSSNMDFYQLLSPKLRTYKSYPKEKFMTDESFHKEYGINPCRWPQIRAMSGDSTDNIIGLPKVGIVTALRLFKAGLRLPIRHSYEGGMLPQIKVERYSTEKLTMSDWMRVRKNLRLSQLVCDMNDPRLPEHTARIVKRTLADFLSFRRHGSKIDRWALMKKLAKYELHDVNMRLDDLLFLY